MEVSAKDLEEMVLYDTEHYYIPEKRVYKDLQTAKQGMHGKSD